MNNDDPDSRPCGNPDAAEEIGGADRREQILDAAFAEFAEHGFRGATIKRIAQRAKLESQALIYWYFPAKEAHFEAVLGQRLPILQMVLDSAPFLERPPAEALPMIARAYLASADRPGAPRLVGLLAPERIRRPEVADAVGGPLIAKILDFIETYLAHQVEWGRLRPHDVRASAASRRPHRRGAYCGAGRDLPSRARARTGCLTSCSHNVGGVRL